MLIGFMPLFSPFCYVSIFGNLSDPMVPTVSGGDVVEITVSSNNGLHVCMGWYTTTQAM